MTLHTIVAEIECDVWPPESAEGLKYITKQAHAVAVQELSLSKPWPWPSRIHIKVSALFRDPIDCKGGVLPDGSRLFLPPLTDDQPPAEEGVICREYKLLKPTLRSKTSATAKRQAFRSAGKSSSKQEETFTCSYEGCHKIFASSASLWSHSRSHKTYTFSCGHCGWQFARRDNICRHLWTHVRQETRKEICSGKKKWDYPPSLTTISGLGVKVLRLDLPKEQMKSALLEEK